MLACVVAPCCDLHVLFVQSILVGKVGLLSKHVEGVARQIHNNVERVALEYQINTKAVLVIWQLGTRLKCEWIDGWMAERVSERIV